MSQVMNLYAMPVDTNNDRQVDELQLFAQLEERSIAAERHADYVSTTAESAPARSKQAAKPEEPVSKVVETQKAYASPVINTAHNWWLALIAFLLFLHLILMPQNP